MADDETLGFATLGDLEEAARRKVPGPVWDYVQGGAESERSLAENRSAFARWPLRPRVLRGVGSVDLSTTVLGARVQAPFYVSPTAYHGAVHPEAEPATSRAAARAEVLAVFSTLSSRSLEEIAAAAPGPRWFQLYLQPDRKVTDRLIERAERSGYRAIVLTVDAPILAPRDRQVRSGFAWNVPPPMGNGPEVRSPARSPTEKGGRFLFRSENAEGWKILREIGSVTRLPVVVKGILTAEDARAAVAAGARGVVVSNHGGRQLDGTAAPLEVLPEVVAEVRNELEVYVDGGFRRGSELLVALAMGARAVGLGRPVLWALGAAGEPGVARFLSLLRTELAVDMALAGVASVDQVPDLLRLGARDAAERTAGVLGRAGGKGTHRVRRSAGATVKRRGGSRRRNRP